MKQGNSYTKVNNRTYRTKFYSKSTLFEDTVNTNRSCLVDNKIKVSELAALPFFTNFEIREAAYVAD